MSEEIRYGFTKEQLQELKEYIKKEERERIDNIVNDRRIMWIYEKIIDKDICGCVIAELDMIRQKIQEEIK